MSLTDHVGFGRKSSEYKPRHAEATAEAPAPVKPAPESFAPYEPEAKPDYAQWFEDLRGALLDSNDQPGVGLEELRHILALAKSTDVPTESLLEAMGIAHSLDQRFGRDTTMSMAPDQAIQEATPLPDGGDYARLLSQLKFEVYKTPGREVPLYAEVEDIVPDVIRGKLSSDDQALPWTGFPVEVFTHETPGARHAGDQSSPLLTLTVGPEQPGYVWHAKTPDHPDITIDDEAAHRLGGIALHSVPPHLEAKDPSGTTYFQTFKYPHPEEVKQRNELAAARKAIDQQS